MDLVSKQTDEALGWATESAKAVEDAPQVNTGLSFKDAATFVASATPIIGDAMAAKEVYDELNKEDPNYFLAGALGGAALVGLVPGLGDAAANAIRAGAKKAAETAKRIEVDPNALGSIGGNIKLKPKEPFKKTRSAYRIATQSEDGKLYPLFVNAADEIPVGEWVSASIPPVTFKGANGNMYVPSKGAARSKGEKAKPTGDMQTIPDQETADILRDKGFAVEKPSKSAPYGKVRAVASRPGFHATTKPVAHHLGPEDLIISSSERNKLLKAGITPKAFKAKTFNYLDGKLIGKKKVSELSPEDRKRVKSKKKYYVKRRAEDQVFVEVEMADDTSEDLLKYMQERNRTDINDKLPSGGSYTYQDGQADAETWVVGGDMKVNRVLSREEAKAAQEAAGVKDLPYRSEIEEILGRKFAKGGLVGEEDMYTGQQDSILAAGMANDLMQDEDEQTRMAFALGGSVEDVDPVSGNEVPTGSLPEEVRDDIPAQLSEGEYVVPADVVRFYGVKFFEDLRTQAKQGFADMEANGRIGGEPIQPQGMEMVEPEDEDFPFDISELQTVAVDQPMVNMKDGGYLKGYNEGGDVTTPVMPKQYVIPDVSSIFGANFTGNNTGYSMGNNIEYREYRDPKTGTAFSLRFVNGKPDAAAQAMIDLGYVPAEDYSASAEITVEQPDTGESTSVNPSRESNSFSEQEEKVKSAQNTFKEYEDWELFELAERLGDPKVNKAISGLGSFAGPVGLIASIGKRVTGFAVARELADRYKTAETDEDKAKIQTLFDGVTTRGKERESGITGGGGLLGGGGILQDVDNSGEIDFGDTWLGDLLGFDVGGAGIQGPSQSDSWDGARRTGGTGSEANLDLGEHVDTDRDSAFAEYTGSTDRTSLAPTEEELGDTRPRARPTEEELDDTRPRARPTTDTSASSRDDNDSNRNVSGGSNVIGTTSSGSNIYSAKDTGKKDAQGRTLYTF